MTLRLGRLRISFDYITAAFICGLVVLGADSRYLIALVCTALHECGHVFAMLYFGSESIDININLFNIEITDKARLKRPYKQDIAIIAVGPAVNFFTAVLFYLLFLFCQSDVVYAFFAISLVLGIFNLLPMESTDGGQLLKIFLTKKLEPSAVNIIMTVVTLVILIPIAVLGFYITLNSRYNYTLLFAAMYMCALIIMKKTKLV